MIWYGPKPGGSQGQQEQGYGDIIYNDRVAIREKFTDPSPYLAVINNWLLAAAGQLGKSPGLTQPIAFALVAKRPNVMPARITERGNEQICAHFAAADLDQALTKIDLHLLPGGVSNRTVARASSPCCG